LDLRGPTSKGGEGGEGRGEQGRGGKRRGVEVKNWTPPLVTQTQLRRWSGMTFHLVYDSLDCHLQLSEDNWKTFELLVFDVLTAF